MNHTDSDEIINDLSEEKNVKLTGEKTKEPNVMRTYLHTIRKLTFSGNVKLVEKGIRMLRERSNTCI